MTNPDYLPDQTEQQTTGQTYASSSYTSQSNARVIHASDMDPWLLKDPRTLQFGPSNSWMTHEDRLRLSQGKFPRKKY